VILCYKSGKAAEGFVQKTIEAIDRKTPRWELILVGNYLKGTDDITPQVVAQIAARDKRIKAIALEKEGMMGWDLRSGLDAATGKIIGFIDGDGQMPTDDIIKVYTMLKDENLDFVKTYRYRRDDGIVMKLYSDIDNIIFRLLFPGYRVKDINSKPKTFTKEAFQKLNLTADDWFIDAEMIIQARRHKLQIGEIPTVFLKSESRKSFVKFSHIFEFLGNFLTYRTKEFFISH